ncbi:hypothetical protein [Halobacillus litoralis]|uniref:hypothetical protein n=1 Tax=Halobacillus litoralis TaxID=45668 RepID=UPI0024911EE4|nr:hypothetical protein [Halobacillus litoralis]
MEFIELNSWIAPSLLFMTLAALAGSYFCFKAEKYFMLMGFGMVQTLISTLFAGSIGPVLFGIGLIQFYVGIVNIKKVKAMSHE